MIKQKRIIFKVILIIPETGQPKEKNVEFDLMNVQYEKKITKIHPTRYQYATNSLFDVLVKVRWSETLTKTYPKHVLKKCIGGVLVHSLMEK